MFRTLFYLVPCVVLLSICFTAKADLVIINGDFETGGGENIPDVTGWYDNSTSGFWEDAWQTNASWITPNGSNVVVFCSWDTMEGDPLAGSYLYQSIGTSAGESSVVISFDWGCPDDVAAGRHDALTVSVLASDGSFVANDANDVLGAAGITVLDSASYDYVALGTDGEIFPVVVTLDLSGAKVGDEIFLRFNNYLPEAGADPWPVLDNVQITVPDMTIGFATPVIDGEVDDVWADAAAAAFVPLADPADGSGTWKVLYDADNLYVIVDVTDDVLQNDSASSWQDDSVEIYFDGGNTKLSTPLSGDDHQYTFGWTTDDIQGTNIVGYTDGIEHAQVTTDTGWRIEVKMPWMSIWGILPQAGDLIGIDCYYNDDDDGGDSREGKMLSFSAIEGWNDASQWGTAVLAPQLLPVDPGTDGLVAYYELENDVNDSSGNGLNGTIVGGPNFVDGAAGMGLQLDGVDDYVDLGNDPLFDLTEQVTLSLWVNTQDIGTTQNNPWLGKGDTSYMIKGHRVGNQIEFFIYDGGWVTAHADVGADFNGQWHHVAGTFDGEQLKIYVDGKEAVSVDYEGVGIVPNTYNVAIGTNTQAPNRFSESIVDEAMIFNRALSEGEILYLAGFRENLVQNPSFEKDEAVLDDPDWAQWCTWNPAEGAGSNAIIVDTDSADGSKSLFIEPIGPENWHFIVLYLPIPTEVGVSYTASFMAKAAESRPLGVQFKATDNSVQWGYADFDLTTEWAEYILTAEALNAETKLEFFCAGSEVPFSIDAVSVTKD